MYRNFTLVLFLYFSVLLLGKNVEAARKKSSSSSSSSSSAEQESSNRLNTLAARFQKSPLPISLTDKNFTKFIKDRPREYTAIIMFTALGQKYQCSICHRSNAVFSEVSSFYHDQYNFNTSSPNQRLAFFTVDIDGSRETFNDMSLESVPRFYALPPRNVDSPMLRIGEFELNVRAAIDGAGPFLEELNKAAGVNILVTMNPLPLQVGLCLFALILAIFVSAASQNINEAIFWYRNKYIWMVLSYIFFSVGVSGSIYCVIRSAPFYGVSRHGEMQIFAGQGRDQYFIEGIIVAGWAVGCGLSVAAMYYSTKLSTNFFTSYSSYSTTSSSSTTSSTTTSSNSEKSNDEHEKPKGSSVLLKICGNIEFLFWAIIRHMCVLLSMTVFLVLTLQVWEAYVDKTRWYSLKETVPEQLWSFLTSAVKKSSGLPKRLVRLSEYYLFEYRDFAGFQKKAKQLVFDYLYRIVTGKDLHL